MALALGVVLATEIGITLADFIVEDQVRRPLGGLLPGERATHTIMAIIYGAMIANLVPVLLAWHRSATGLHPEPVNVPLAYRLALTALAAGTCASAVRDAYAVAGFPRRAARWPWPQPSTPQPSSPSRPGAMKHEKAYRAVFLAAGAYNIPGASTPSRTRSGSSG